MRREARVVTRAVADAEADEDGKPRARLVRGADGKFVREGSEGGGGRGGRGGGRGGGSDGHVGQHLADDSGAISFPALRRLFAAVKQTLPACAWCRFKDSKRQRSTVLLSGISVPIAEANSS